MGIFCNESLPIVSASSFVMQKKETLLHLLHLLHLLLLLPFISLPDFCIIIQKASNTEHNVQKWHLKKCNM